MKNTVSKWEIVWIVLSSIVGLTGIVLAILGVVADYLPVKASENFLSGSEAYFEGIFHLSFTWAGAILVIVAALIAAIFLSYFANKADREKERSIRREQRKRILEEEGEEAPAPEEVPATSGE